MTPGAVGCALSHRAIWQNLLHDEGAEDCWLVLEDALPQELQLMGKAMQHDLKRGLGLNVSSRL